METHKVRITATGLSRLEDRKRMLRFCLELMTLGKVEIDDCLQWAVVKLSTGELFNVQLLESVRHWLNANAYEHGRILHLSQSVYKPRNCGLLVCPCSFIEDEINELLLSYGFTVNVTT